MHLDHSRGEIALAAGLTAFFALGAWLGYGALVAIIATVVLFPMLLASDLLADDNGSW